MQKFLQKMPFLIELFLNGSYIILYSLFKHSSMLDEYPHQLIETILHSTALMVPFSIFFILMVNYMSSRSFESFMRKHVFSLFVFFPLVIMWGDLQFTFLLSSAHLISSIFILYEKDEIRPAPTSVATRSWFKSLSLKPAQAVIISFVGLSVFGAMLLMLPLSTISKDGIGFVDALFMSSSATCVTGLTTVSLTEDFSLFGQIIILLLIQVGGLGYMTLSSSLTILLGRSIAIREKLMMQDLLGVNSQENLSDMIVDIVKYTFFIELWGGILLSLGFFFMEDYELSSAIYYGIFHSVSAFCNAGFALFDNSLVNFASNPVINFTIMGLITFGGFGFIVLRELRDVALHKKSIIRLSLHSKIVLSTSFILTIFGTLIIFFGEYLHALDAYSLWDKIQISIFQSVTLRTAGFNTIELGHLHSYTLYAMMLFMFIGASPGSTGGGIKTTTLAILYQSIRATLRGDKDVRIFKRTIAPETILRVTALTFISIVIVTMSIFLLMKVETKQTLMSIMFEVVSASGTVGLSLGITSFLSASGKIAITIVMLIGRMGPLTLILALGDRGKRIDGVEYPVGKTMIG